VIAAVAYIATFGHPALMLLVVRRSFLQFSHIQV
jgi:hypothetical protein